MKVENYIRNKNLEIGDKIAITISGLERCFFDKCLPSLKKNLFEVIGYDNFDVFVHMGTSGINSNHLMYKEDSIKPRPTKETIELLRKNVPNLKTFVIEDGIHVVHTGEFFNKFYPVYFQNGEKTIKQIEKYGKKYKSSLPNVVAWYRLIELYNMVLAQEHINNKKYRAVIKQRTDIVWESPLIKTDFQPGTFYSACPVENNTKLSDIFWIVNREQFDDYFFHLPSMMYRSFDVEEIKDYLDINDISVRQKLHESVAMYPEAVLYLVIKMNNHKVENINFGHGHPMCFDTHPEKNLTEIHDSEKIWSIFAQTGQQVPK